MPSNEEHENDPRTTSKVNVCGLHNRQTERPNVVGALNEMPKLSPTASARKPANSASEHCKYLDVRLCKCIGAWLFRCLKKFNEKQTRAGSVFHDFISGMMLSLQASQDDQHDQKSPATSIGQVQDDFSLQFGVEAAARQPSMRFDSLAAQRRPRSGASFNEPTAAAASAAATNRKQQQGDHHHRASFKATGSQNQDSRFKESAARDIETTTTSGEHSRAPLLIANLIIFIAHLIALISNIDYELLAELSSQARSLTVQNLHSQVLDLNNQVANDDRAHSNNHRAVESSQLMKMMMMMPINVDAPKPLDEDDEPGRRRPHDGRPVMVSGGKYGRRDYITSTSWSRGGGGGRCSSQLSSLSSDAGAREERAHEAAAAIATKPNREPTTTHILYYLLIVTLMDFLSAMHRHGSHRMAEAAAVAAETKTTARGQRPPSLPSSYCSLGSMAQLLSCWFKAGAVLLATSPKYLFQLSQVVIVALVLADEPTLPLSPEHERGANLPLRRLTSLMSLMNLLNQTFAYALRVYEAKQAYSGANNHELLQRQQQQGDDYDIQSPSRAVADRDYRDANGHFDQDSNTPPLKRLKCCLMISRLCHLKLTLMTLFLYLDSLRKPFEITPSSAILSVCVIQTFFAMHEHYDEYHTKYLLSATDSMNAPPGERRRKSREIRAV